MRPGGNTARNADKAWQVEKREPQESLRSSVIESRACFKRSQQIHETDPVLSIFSVYQCLQMFTLPNGRWEVSEIELNEC